MQWDEEKETKYMIYVQNEASMETITFKDATTPYNITGLESNTEFTVVVEAYNSLGSANGSKMGCTLPEGWSDYEYIKIIYAHVWMCLLVHISSYSSIVIYFSISPDIQILTSPPNHDIITIGAVVGSLVLIFIILILIITITAVVYCKKYGFKMHSLSYACAIVLCIFASSAHVAFWVYMCILGTYTPMMHRLEHIFLPEYSVQ